MINHFELLENIVRKNLLCLILLVNSQQKYLELILFDFFFFRVSSIYIYMVLHGFIRYNIGSPDQYLRIVEAVVILYNIVFPIFLFACEQTLLV